MDWTQRKANVSTILSGSGVSNASVQVIKANKKKSILLRRNANYKWWTIAILYIYLQKCEYFFLYKCSITEPIGAKSPAIPADNKFLKIERLLGYPLALFCLAQSYPVPAFRFVFNFIQFPSKKLITNYVM